VRIDVDQTHFNRLGVEGAGNVTEQMEPVGELFVDASVVPSSRRAVLLDDMDRIAASYRNVSVPHWSEKHSPFTPDFGIALLSLRGTLIGYSAFKRFAFNDGIVVYRAGSEILAEFQGRALYTRLTQLVLSSAFRDATPRSTCYYSWRTRNPIVWASNSRLCTQVAPSLDGTPCSQSLSDVGIALAHKLFPGQKIERPSMIMRDIYPHIFFQRPPKLRSDEMLNEAFSQNHLGEADGIFSVGILRRKEE
jgi:hypothetical protein